MIQKKTREKTRKKILTLLTLSLAIIPTFLFAGEEYNAASYNLVGPDGKITAQFTSSIEGTPALFFYDDRHILRLNMGIYPGGAPGVVLMDKEGNPAVSLFLKDDGKTPLLEFKQEGKETKTIGIDTLTQNATTTAKQGQYILDYGSTSPAKIITTKLAGTGRKQMFISYGLSFLFGLVGAYIGGRLAIRRDSKVAEAILELSRKTGEVKGIALTKEESKLLA